ncbi:MAG: hypothetical protein F6J92_28050 [Symploca sp. SIO1A3]|nr:hypothetical protein [Symploca sp. SIO1A3]
MNLTRNKRQRQRESAQPLKLRGSGGVWGGGGDGELGKLGELGRLGDAEAILNFQFSIL